MENAFYVGLSRQVALQKRMALVSNNIANVETPGYRADKILFEEYVVEPKPVGEEISMVLDYGQYKDTAPGKTRYTGNKLDVALDGPGFMQVEVAPGEIQYTRAGNFALNALGELVTPEGLKVLDNGGGAITLPDNVREITITKDGSVTTDQGVAGQIGMMEFDNVQELVPTGRGLYEAPEGVVPVEAENTMMQQGMLEGSNVNAVLEMTDLIEISRQYQSMQRNLQNDHDRQRDMIQKLTE